MLALTLYFLLSHIFSFLCSIFEAVLLSTTFSYVALLKKKGIKNASKLEVLKLQIDRPLSAILTLNTIAHTFGAAGVGAKVVEIFGNQWLGLASVLLTLTMLYWTEMLPKTIGALYWKKLVTYCILPIHWLIYLTYPFVISFTFFGKFLASGKKVERVTEEEIRLALESGAKSGDIRPIEQDMVENIFRLSDRKVGMLMSPRVDIDWIDSNDTLEETRNVILNSRHHRFPVCEGDIDQVLGIIDTHDFFENALEDRNFDIKNFLQTPLFVNENQLIFELIRTFKKIQNKMALVIDEYGCIQGMIALSDIMGAVIKDIDEKREGDLEAQIIRINERTWVLDGKLPIDEFKEIFHINSLPDEQRARYRTLGGLCMSQLGAIPNKGDVFKIGFYRYEILKVYKRRVEKVLLIKQENFDIKKTDF